MAVIPKTYHLYQLRDPSTSAGLGFDGYHGITGRPPKQRFHEHMKACASGQHPNPKVQALYDNAGGQLEFSVVRSGTEEQILASEGLLVRRAGMHANVQTGGGRLRGRTYDGLVDLLHGKQRRSGQNRFDKPGANALAGPSGSGGGQLALIICVGTLIVAGVSYMLYRRNGNDESRAAIRVPYARHADLSGDTDLKVGMAVRSGRNWSAPALRAASVLYEALVHLQYGRRR